MKSPILRTTVAALLAAVPLIAQEAQTSASSSVTTNSDGTATVTIEVNGKKDTRTFKLGGNNVFTVAQDGAAAGAKVRKTGEKETWIGIGVGTPISAEVRAQLPLQPGEGVTVFHVAPDSPAAKAGIAVHDILARLDDQILINADQFKKLVKMRKPGETAKLAYFRKGERHEAEVTFAEHEAVPEHSGEGMLRLLTDGEQWGLEKLSPEKWQERLQILREKTGPLRERLKEAKEKFPGVIVDKQAFILGVDGTVKKLEGELQNIEGLMKGLREQLENADIPNEVIQEVRKAVEGAIDKAGHAAVRAAGEALREFHEKRESEKNTLEAPKVEPPAQPAPPAPPIKSPL